MESNGYNPTPEERRQLIDSIPKARVVDACKENIQPRKSGRSVASLTTLFETSPNEREREIALGRKKFEEQLDTIDEHDDPIEIYIKYIEWTHDMFPQGQSTESNLVGLLSDATNRLKSIPRYKTDSRYLKLWLEYTHYVDEPIKIFNFLIKEGIGQELALFYEEFSAYFERLKKVKDAVEVYEKGIAVSADPLKRLQKNLIHLKSRINERQQRGLLRKEQSESRTQMNELKQQGRIMLGHKFDSRSRSSVAANVYSGIEASISSPPSTLTRSRTFGNDRPSSTTQLADIISSPSSSFSVFVETTPSPPTNLFSPSSSSHQPIITPAAHQKVENQRSVEKFSGAILPQAEIVSEPIEPFQVYQDDTTQTSSPTHHIRSLERSDSMLSISTGEESTLSKIRRNPTFDHTDSSNGSSAHKRQKMEKPSPEVIKHNKELARRFDEHKDIYLRTHNSKGGIEYISISKHQHSNMSFEEYRALKAQPIVVNEADDVEMVEEFGRAAYTEEMQRQQMNIIPDLTTEAINAMKSVSELFDEKDAYNEDEEDLTWTNPVQKFTTTYRPPANENE